MGCIHGCVGVGVGWWGGGGKNGWVEAKWDPL